MPRDTVLLQTMITDPFEAIGIIPVDPAFVTKYRRNYAAKHKRPGFRDYWYNQPIMTTDVRDRLKNFSRNEMINHHFFITKNPAPKALIALAEHVRTVEPNVKFEVATFLYDPILYATINRERRCLGIWDRGELIAIATRV